MLYFKIEKQVKWKKGINVWETFFKLVTNYRDKFNVGIKYTGHTSDRSYDGIYHRFTDDITVTLQYKNSDDIWLRIQGHTNCIVDINDKINYLSDLCEESFKGE